MKKFAILILMCCVITKAQAFFLTGLLVGGIAGYLIHDAKDKQSTTVIYERPPEEGCRQRVYHYNRDKTVRSVECIK